MTILTNEVKKRMQAGQKVASLNVNRWRSVDIAEIAAKCGFEWLFMDLEHSVMSEEQAGQIAMLALRTGVTPIARVGSNQWYQASRLLDAGCKGIVFQHVDDADQARAAVSCSKYPPIGGRSLTSPLPTAAYGRASSKEAMADLNAQTLTIVMVETQVALENVDAIASVPGVDAIMIGTNDLAADLGLPGELGHERITAAYSRVGQSCRDCNIFLGIGGVYTAPLIERYLAMGVHFMLGGADIGFLIEGARNRRELISVCAKP